MRIVLARVGLALFGALAGIGCLALLEAALALLGAGEGAPGYDPFAGFSAVVPLFERSEASDGTALYRVSPARLWSGGGPEEPDPSRTFLADKRPDGFRVFVVGGSSAAGFPYGPSLAFSGVLERRLRAALPEVPIEIVNAAIDGYSSRRVLIAVREIVTHEPDLLIVYSGHNEWAERRYYSRLLELDPRLFRLREWIFSTRLFTVASRLLPQARVDRDELLRRFVEDERREFVEMFAVFSSRAEGSGYASPEEIRQRDRLYRLNLEEIVRTARARGARVVLLTLSQNFSEWSPGASSHRADLGSAETERWKTRVDDGERAAIHGDCAEALDAWSEALAIDDTFAELHYRVARCQQRLGRLELARRHFRRASDLDRIPHGAPTYFNDVLRELAEREDALLVDVDALLEGASGERLVGNDLFIEFAHPNLRAHQLVAAELEGALRRAGLPRPAHRWLSDAYRDPDVASLYARDPTLRVREHEAIRFVCAVARRADCVAEHERALRSLREQAPPAASEVGRSSRIRDLMGRTRSLE